MSVLVLLVILLCIVLAAALWSWLRKGHNPLPEFPGALPIIGHSLQLLGDRKLVANPEDSLTLANSLLNKPFFYDFAKDYINNGLITAEDKFKPVLDKILQMAEEQDAFTDEEIREHLDTFVAAAYDTTSSSLTLILLIIASDPKLQERLYNEIQAVTELKDDDITKQDLPKLMYLEAVIKESMRLYPSVPLIGRKFDTDVKLKNYTFHAGSTCVVGVYGLLRHPMWGPDAEQFRPERWLDPANLPDHPSLNAAFGVGKRNCIGKLYGMMVMKTALAHILRRYHITGNIKSVVCEYDIVLKPVEGHLIGLTLRT